MLVTRVERLEAIVPREGPRWDVLAFAIEATVSGPVIPRHGMVVNLTAMKEQLRREVVETLAGRRLDGTEGAPDLPSAEALAHGIWELLGGRLGGLPLERVRLVGTPSPVVEWTGDRMHVTRVFEFSASHRLHSPQLSDAENRALFGKCNNPAGHGHNYVLEVTVRGEPGAAGELLPAAEFDRVVGEEVVEVWDHRNLNEDVTDFDGLNPTAEEIARRAWRRLAGPLLRAAEAAGTDARLWRVKLRETERNHVEYFGEDE
jgi:6-pyruvoyltetrahydropterin/6-carboxytetrahydropterin synthase